MTIEEIKDGVQKLLDQADKSAESAKNVVSVCNAVNNSWSGSDLVGHANFFYGNFDTPPHNRRFSVEWGLINGVPDGWSEKSNDEVLQKIQNDSGVSPEELDKDADFIDSDFERLRRQAVITFSNISKDAADQIEKFNLQTKVDIFNQYWSRRIATRDSGALFAGRQIPTHKYYWATASFLAGAKEQLNEFLYLIDKVAAQYNKNSVQKEPNEDTQRSSYIDENTLLRLRKIENENFDLSRLVNFCHELNDNYSLENYYSCAMLLRAILDHIPPIFGKTSFSDVASQHGGKSLKKVLHPLDETAKKIGDDYLHKQISKKVLTVTKTQVSFQANLDMLLNEVAAILESGQQ